MSKSLTQKINGFLSNTKDFFFPNRKADLLLDCVFLVSFPKSGNTWVRFMIANLYNEMEPRFNEIDFHNIHEIVPELEKPLKFKFGNLPKIIKTHQEYKKKFNCAILILRNPYDALYSYFQYINGEKKLNLSLSEIINHNKFGIEAIVNHTDSYIKNCNELHIVTYEQLHSDPFKYFKNICLFIGIECNDECINNAVNKSSFESMRRIEQAKGRKYGTNDFSFMRKGNVGDGLSEINLEDLESIKKSIKKSPIINLIYG